MTGRVWHRGGGLAPRQGALAALLLALLIPALPALAQVTGDVEPTSLTLTGGDGAVTGGIVEGEASEDGLASQPGGLVSEAPPAEDGVAGGVPESPAPDSAPAAEVLIAPVQSAAPWRDLRASLNAYPAQLRPLLLEAGSEDQLMALFDAYDADAAEFLAYSRSLAPQEHAEIEAQVARLDKMMDHLASDYALGDARRVGTTLRLVEETLARIEELCTAAQARAAGAARSDIHLAPSDWGEQGLSAPGLRTSMAAQDAAALISRGEAALRRATVLPDPALRQEGRALALELAEIARALVLRQAELREDARAGFRNAALRLEVIAENLGAFVEEKDMLSFRRQMIEAHGALAHARLVLKAARLEPTPAPSATSTEAP